MQRRRRAVSEYLSCGHPRACLVSSDDGTHYCAACERGGWVYCCPQKFEGLPPDGQKVDIAWVETELAGFIGLTGHYPGKRVMETWYFCDNEGNETYLAEELGCCVYGWRFRDDPPPLPEGE
jgi:hypothetical protein